jgi:monovalent cation/proton antiporter MnhG/PhaG subunit
MAQEGRGPLLLTAALVVVLLLGASALEWRRRRPGADSGWLRQTEAILCAVVGLLLTLAGAACLQPAWALKLLLIGLFILFTNPISSQVLARAAHRSGAEKSSLTSVDRLEEDRGA